LNAPYLYENTKFGSFFKIHLEITDGKPIQNETIIKEVPATTPLSDEMSKDLKKRGFKFVGFRLHAIG
jgi:DNA-3-methyladenine glycosylase I